MCLFGLFSSSSLSRGFSKEIWLQIIFYGTIVYVSVICIIRYWNQGYFREIIGIRKLENL